MLFLKDKNIKKEAWTGKLLGPQGAKEILGINSAFSNDSFPNLNIDFSKFKKVYFSDKEEGLSNTAQKQFIGTTLKNKEEHELNEIMSRGARPGDEPRRWSAFVRRSSVRCTCLA